MIETVRELLESKKFLAAFSGSVAAMLVKLAGHYGVVLDKAVADSLVQIILVCVGVFVAAQGVADHGKSAAEIHADVAAAGLEEAARQAALLSGAAGEKGPPAA